MTDTIPTAAPISHKKYKLNGQTVEVAGVTLHRIEALIAIPLIGVKVGDIGGWVQAETNLSHEGNSWVYGLARVFGNAQVYGDAVVLDYARVSGHARVCGHARVYGDAQIFGHALVRGNDVAEGDDLPEYAQ